MHLIGRIEKISDRKMYLTIYLLLIIFVIDTSITKISAFTGSFDYIQSLYNILFICIAASFGFIQFIILRTVQYKSRELMLHEKLKLNVVTKVVTFVNFGLLALLVIIIFEMNFTSQYHVGFVSITILASYGLMFVMLNFLSLMFLRWLKRVRTVVVIAYTAAIIMLSINTVITIIFMTTELGDVTNVTYPSTSPVGAFNISNFLLNNLYNITSVTSFVLMWAATVILLNYYSKVIGKVKYWILVSIPLVYFLASFQPLIVNLFLPFREANPIIFGLTYTLFFSATKPAGAVLFGAAFWILARNLPDKKVKNYLLICSYGMTILFAANQPIGLLLTPYPPFGLATISFVGLSSFLVLLGIYSSAISVSEDSSLRQTIRNIAMKEPRLLDSIGTAQMEQEIEKKVLSFTKQNQDKMTEETGIQSSLTEEDMKQYLEQVISEVNMQRTSDKKSGTNNGKT